MKTITLNQPHQFALSETEPPNSDALKPGEALVRVHRVGVCGTDLHAYRGKQPFFSYPRILGHELGVEVIEVNSTNNQSTHNPLTPGDRCSVEPYLNCGSCIACRNGKSNCCTSLRVLGVHTDGGMRELITVPTHKLHKSSVLSYEQLALIETLGIGAHAVDRAQLRADEWVLVIGAGPIGLSAIQFAQLHTPNVIVMDISPQRLEFCGEQLRVPHLVRADQEPLKQIETLTSGDLPTAVFDATGNIGSMNSAFKYVAHGGKLVFVGLTQAEVSFDDPFFHRREISLFASRNALSKDFPRIIQLVESGRIDTRPWVTHRASANEMAEQFDGWLKPETGVIK
ncbi:MAG: zinc-binding alcohol dehydrogenase family protein, partial [Anaerolineae bacterium]|nr:zinc-binding alcohol dehydrogenase family protein [Anaerolineae bacterium]